MSKKPIIRALFFIILITFGCSDIGLDEISQTCTSSDFINEAHPKAFRLQEKLNQLVELGVPGVVISISDKDTYWTGTAGLAKLETNLKMEACHLQFGQSVAKTYMATAILMLYEKGKINLDAKITNYLPESITSNIANADKATIRMLLQHRSGIPDCYESPEYITYLLQHPLHHFSTLDYLNYIYDAPANFSVDEKYQYSNTNYVLLALIADEITGDHKKFIQNELLLVQDLKNTFYHNEGFLEKSQLVNTYWDRYSNGAIENCSEMQRVNVASLIGDDGIVATPIDYVKFLENLLENRILSSSTMTEMLDFIQQTPDSPDGYGMGLYQKFINGHEQIGNTGGGIGAGCSLGYFSDTNTYYFIGINLGTSIMPKKANSIEVLLNEIFDILVE